MELCSCVLFKPNQVKFLVLDTKNAATICFWKSKKKKKKKQSHWSFFYSWLFTVYFPGFRSFEKKSERAVSIRLAGWTSKENVHLKELRWRPWLRELECVCVCVTRYLQHIYLRFYRNKTIKIVVQIPIF